MESKTCFRCGKCKPETEFYKHPMMADGRLGKCVECAKADVKANRSKRAAEYKKYERERFKKPERKAQLAEYQRKSRIKNRDKWIARRQLRYAVVTGKLAKKPCEICGNPVSEAHHHDYSKPLDVRWLCFVHHRNEHRSKS